MKHLLAFLFVFTLFTGSIRLFADESGHDQGQQLTETEKQALNKLKQQLINAQQVLDLSRKNDEGRVISYLNFPHQYLQVLDHIEMAWIDNNFPEYEKVPLEVEELTERIYYQVFVKLLYGSDEYKKGDGTGWFLGNKHGETGLKEMMEIISRDRFPIEKIPLLVTMAKELNINGRFNVLGGFPKERTDIVDLHLKSLVVKSLQSLAEAHQDLILEHSLPTFRELVETASANLSEEVQKSIFENYKLLEMGTIRNEFDQSIVTTINYKMSANYQGREKELKQMAVALNRTQQSHVLLTGKFASGKKALVQLLSQALLSKKYSVRHQDKAPIILTITSLSLADDGMNPERQIQNYLDSARNLSELLDRDFILHIPNAEKIAPESILILKEFMSIPTDGINSRVHIILSLDTENKRFLNNKALLNEMVQIHINELNEVDTKALVKSHIKVWIHHQPNLINIRDEAIDKAIKLAAVSQSSSESTSLISETKKIIEGAIAQRAVEEKDGRFYITADNILSYVKSGNNAHGLIPGDSHLEENFNQLWAQFDKKYVGQPELKASIKPDIFNHFASINKERMTGLAFFGPSNSGKSYLAEKLAEALFNNEPLVLDGSTLQHKEDSAKIIGSPPGYIGSNEKYSFIERYTSEHPEGGIIVLESTELVHQENLDILTQMVKHKKLTTALGEIVDLSKFIFILNSNIGQDLMLPTKNWEEYSIRRIGLTQIKKIEGVENEVVKSSVLDDTIERLMSTIYTKSHPNSHQNQGSQVNQLTKQIKGIFSAFYCFPPRKEELKLAAYSKVQQYIKDAKNNYGVKININTSAIDRIIKIDEFDFDRGFSYVDYQLKDKLFRYLNPYLSNRDETIHISLTSKKGEDFLRIKSGGFTDDKGLGVKIEHDENQWSHSPEMKNRIRNFAVEMNKEIKGKSKELIRMQEKLKLKLMDWDTRLVFTMLGTTGNGKTRIFEVASKVLFGDENALFKIENLTHESDLSHYIRMPGDTIEKKFEKWIKMRKSAGGGIILLDELLSFNGLTEAKIAEKVAILQKLYTLFDQGYIDIAGERIDARGFIIATTGNLFQDHFKMDNNPDTERQIAKIIAELTEEAISSELAKYGFDAPKRIRLGDIFISGPLDQDSVNQISRLKINENLKKAIKKLPAKASIAIDERIGQLITSHTSTTSMGMRIVDNTILTILKAPVAGIVNDIGGEKINSLEAHADQSGNKILWYVNGKEVIYTGNIIDEKSKFRDLRWKFRELASEVDFAPKISDLPKPKIEEMTKGEQVAVAIHEIYGHFMVNTLITGKNSSEVIRLIPGPGYLGYVMPKDLPYESRLKQDIARIAVLAAGARSLFIEGIRVGGGGTHGRNFMNMKKDVTDDNGKIEMILDSILSNDLVGNIHEFSTPQDKHVVKEMIRIVGQTIAEEYIKLGRESGEFLEIFEHTFEKGLVTHEYLDAAVAKINIHEKFGNLDELFVKFFNKGIDALDDHDELLKEAKYRKFKTDLQKHIKVEDQNYYRLERYHDTLVANQKAKKAKEAEIKLLQSKDCSTGLKTFIKVTTK